MLSEEQINAVGNIKNILKEIILLNHGNTVETIIEIFKDVINREHADLNIEIIDIQVLEETIQTVITVDKAKFNFELNLDIPKDDGRFQKLVDECEPWRKTSPDLVEAENKLKEWANSFGRTL